MVATHDLADHWVCSTTIVKLYVTSATQQESVVPLY